MLRGGHTDPEYSGRSVYAGIKCLSFDKLRMTLLQKVDFS